MKASATHVSLALALAALSAPAHAVVYLVGSGAGCQFPTIQAAITAATNNPGADEVRIANGVIWGNQALTVTGTQDLIIDGSFETCTSTTPNGNYAQLVGSGGANAPVINISGNGIKEIRGIQVRDSTGAVSGGGINFVGNGELILGRVEIINNTASFGGGITFNGNGGFAALTLQRDTIISGNRGEVGGGIYLTGTGQLFAVEPQISIDSNISNSTGGGISIAAVGRAYLGSNGYNGNAMIRDNTAVDGGGVAVDASSPNSYALVNFFTTDANAPVRLSGNRASAKGGAAYILPSAQRAVFCGFGAHIIGNSAVEGSAIYGDLGSGDALVYYNTRPLLCDIPTFIGRTNCTRGRGGCNIIEQNQNRTSTNVATSGATILMQDRSFLSMQDFILGNNIGGNLIRMIEGDELYLDTGLLAVNTVSANLLRFNFRSGDQGMRMSSMTIANNSIAGSTVTQFEDGPNTLRFNNNLIWQPGKTSVTIPFAIANTQQYDWRFNAGFDVGTLLPAPTNLNTLNPRFENIAVNDYRLKVGSMLVDTFPDQATPRTMDLDGATRPITIPERQQTVRVDVGAFERQPSYPWITDGGFASSLAYWQAAAGGFAATGVVWDAQDANASPTSGSALVNLPSAPTSPLTALSQCFNVPGPGTFDITAKSRTGTILQADFGRLTWTLRYNGNSGTCNGTSQGSATVNFGSPAASGWRTLAPTTVTVPAADWTPNTTIELRLDVFDGAITVGTGLTNVRFDDVQISAVSVITEEIFKNGFEQ
jgi:hypothetical protein